VLFLLSGEWHPAPTLAQVPSGTPAYNVNAKWVTDRGSQVFDVMAYGAKCDGTTDDAAAINSAISAANPGYNYGGSYLPAGITLIPGGCAIGSTINVAGILEGIGSGSGQSGGAGAKCYLKWIGAAGSPMIRIYGRNTTVRDLGLIGNTTNLPSEAILIDNVTGYGEMGLIYNIYAGQYAGGGTGIQFTNGITWNGTTGGDSFKLDAIHVDHVSGACINNPNNGNASDEEIDNLFIEECGVGVLWQGLVTGNNWEFGPNTTADFVLGRSSGGTGPAVLVRGFVGGGTTPQFAKLYSGGLEIDGGAWVVPSSPTNPTLDASNSTSSVFLSNFSFSENTNPGQWPTIAGCTAAEPGSSYYGLNFINVGGIRPTDITCNAIYQDPRSSAEFEYKQVPSWNGFGTWTRNIIQIESGAFDWRRFDLLHEFDEYGGPVVVHQLPPPLSPACTPTGSGSTSYGYRVTSIANSANFSGETTPTAEVTCTNAATLGGSNTNLVKWAPMLGAVGYNIYCRTPGSELYCATVWANNDNAVFASGSSSLSWTDNGSATPSGAMPTVNTTGEVFGVADSYVNGTTWTHNKNWSIDGNGNASVASLTDSGLTAGNYVIAGTGGKLQNAGTSASFFTVNSINWPYCTQLDFSCSGYKEEWRHNWSGSAFPTAGTGGLGYNTMGSNTSTPGCVGNATENPDKMSCSWGTDAASGHGGSISQKTDVIPLSAGYKWIHKWRFQQPNYSTDLSHGEIFHIGIGNSPTTVSSFPGMVGICLDTTQSDAAWVICSDDGSSHRTTQSTGAGDANVHELIVYQVTSGEWVVSLDGGTYYCLTNAASGGCTTEGTATVINSAYLPTSGNLTMFINDTAESANTVTMRLYRTAGEVTGLSSQ
jgi:hypothetical protein